MAFEAADASGPEPVQRRLRVLAIEPFHGGSHRAFLEGWSDRSRHRFDLITLPDRHWKWRMRHAALTAAEQVRGRLGNGEPWDVVWASDMLDLAAFQGLCPEVASLPTVLYFHENQLTYPWRSGWSADDQEDAGRDGHYAYTNFLSALVADRIWFNSGFHRDEWLAALPGFLRRFPEYGHVDLVERVASRSEVQSPGVQCEKPPGGETPKSAGFHVLWAARWEHDKNPETFFDALRGWRESHPEHWRDPDRPVRLHVLGQSYERVPDTFGSALRDFADSIATWGFVDHEDYLRCLHQADVFVSTARHEFFGIATVEALSAGAHPLLPERLSYPELVIGDADGLYPSGGQEADAIALRLAALYEAAGAGRLPSRRRWSRLVERYGWSTRTRRLDKAIERLHADACGDGETTPSLVES